MSPHRHLHDAVTVELQHLPGLVGVVQHHHHLDVGLAAARVAVHPQPFAGGVHPHQQIGLQIRALPVGPAVVSDLFQLGFGPVVVGGIACGGGCVFFLVHPLQQVCPAAQSGQSRCQSAGGLEQIPPADPPVPVPTHLTSAAGVVIHSPYRSIFFKNASPSFCMTTFLPSLRLGGRDVKLWQSLPSSGYCAICSRSSARRRVPQRSKLPALTCSPIIPPVFPVCACWIC